MPDTIVINSAARSYTVVGPERSDETRDLILVFHGSRQTGEGHRRFTGGMFDHIPSQRSAVVVYLDGYKGNWNDSRRESFFPARTENIDDVAFTRSVIARLVQTHGVDEHRVFAVGYSNGGQMVMRLIHESPELLTGATIIGATMPTHESFLFPPESTPVVAVPVLLIHGTKDPIAPYQGGEMSGWAKKAFKVGGSNYSMPQTADYFANRNGFTGEPTTIRISSPQSTRLWISRTLYADGHHAAVQLLTIHGGGHTIPGPKRAPFVLGRTSTEVSAADQIVSYFAIGAGKNS